MIDEEEIDDYEAIPFHPLYKAMSFYDTTNITIEEDELEATDTTQKIQLQMKEIWDTVQLKAVWKPMVCRPSINTFSLDDCIYGRLLFTFTIYFKFQILRGSPISNSVCILNRGS